jgi:hypothetical protein
MKRFFNTIMALLLGAVVAVSCGETEKQETIYTITTDRTAISDVAANAPGAEVLVVTTDAPYWIITTPDWVKADPVTGVGGGESTIVSLLIDSNYKDEATDMNPRSGVIKISGGMTSVSIPINQLGHVGYIDPSSSIGGIPDENEFRDFIAAVNEGQGITRWMNADKEITLLADLDLSSFTEWVPIGNVESTGNGNNGCKIVGNYFTGVFNGNGHTIKNFKASAELSSGQTFGLFGAIKNSTIKNLNVEADFSVSATGAADAGVVVGTAYCSTIDNVKVTATISSTGTSAAQRFAVAGIAGFVYSYYDSTEALAYDSSITNCVVDATVNMDAGDNTGAGATGVMYGGIAAFCTNVKDDSRIHIENCVNNGTLTMRIGRCSGIVPTANYGTIIKSCTNNASQVNTFTNGRIGMICCNLSAQSAIIDCVNNGDLTVTGASTTAGGLVALMGDDSCYLEGGENPSNTGTILGITPKYLGLLCANTNKFDHVKDVILSGKVGLYKEDGNHEMYAVTNDNVLQYVGYINPSYAEKVSNITYVKSDPNEPDPEVPSTGGGIGELDQVNDTWN